MPIDMNKLVNLEDAKAGMSAEHAMIASNYSSSATYAVGAYAYHAGTLYKCTTAITTAEAWTAAHWTTAKLAEDVTSQSEKIDELKTHFEERNNLEAPVIFDITDYNVTEWFAAGINPSTGQDTESTTRIRSNSIPINPQRLLRIQTDNNIKIKVAFYSTAAASTFTGIDTDWTENGAYRDILNTGSKYYIRVVVGYSNDATVTDVADLASHLAITRYIPRDYVSNQAFYDAVYNNIAVSIYNTTGAFWSVETSTAVKTTTSGAFFASDPIAVTEGETYTLTAQQGNTDKTRIWVITDNNYNIVQMCENFKGTTEHTVTFTVPEGGTLLLLTKQANASTQTLVKKVTALDMLLMPLANKKLSLLGDSISAYIGTIPEGNDAYYTGSNSGVSSPNQMWWKVLCDKTGMVPLIINGWSGSGITQLEDTVHINKVPMSSDTRCAALGDGTNNPDIILIAGGLNDYTYAESAQSEPLDWDGKTTPVITNSFTEAYACMIKKLQTNYPNAIVVAMSTWFTMRGTDNGYILTHTVGGNTYTQQDYNDKIRYVAEQMHIPYIDVSNIGFNRNNFYPKYAEDNADTPTHPNYMGHRVMGEAIAECLPTLVAAYLN